MKKCVGNLGGKDNGLFINQFGEKIWGTCNIGLCQDYFLCHYVSWFNKISRIKYEEEKIKIKDMLKDRISLLSIEEIKLLKKMKVLE